MTARTQSSIALSKGRQRSPFGHYSGKVIGVNPEDSSVDIKMYSGDTLRRVRVLLNSANTVAGWKYLSSITNVNPQATSRGVNDTALFSNQADTIAIVIFLDGNLQTPRVTGFDLPINSQMHLKEQGLAITRHESGIYEVIDKNGHHETHYPDGSYVIYATDSTSKNMGALKGNGQAWSVPTSSSKTKLTMHLSEGIDITSDGSGNLKVTTVGKINLNGTLF